MHAAASASAALLGDGTSTCDDDPSTTQPQWRRVEAAESAVDVLFPPDFAVPKGIVHFVGGAVVGAFPRASYGPLLERLAVAVRAVIIVCMVGLLLGAKNRTRTRIHPNTIIKPIFPPALFHPMRATV